MTNHPQLDSAAAVEVAAFCWPEHEYHQWRAVEPMDGPAAFLFDGRSGDPVMMFAFEDFNDLHRAAAVLVGRGLSASLDTHMMAEWAATHPESGSRYHQWLYAAPAEAWARAILATVREVSK